LILLTLSFFACESLILEEDLESTDPETNFEYLWKQIDEKYSYFDLKGIDWDERHDYYAPRVYKDMSEDSLFNLMGAMLRDLRDAHVNLVSYFNISFYNIDLTGPANINWRTITENYLSENYYVSGPFVHDFVADGKIGYVRFPSFSGEVDDDNLDYVLNRYVNTTGLILDLRENGGGTPTDMYNLLSRFVSEKTLIYYSKIKTGAGHNDFSAAKPAYLNPHKGIRYEKPVIVLTDRGTFSAGSFTSLAIKAIPNMTLLGDTTGGGLGAPNGGQLPNGWSYRFSVTQALNLDMDNSYEMGVPPDIYALYDWNDLTKDEVLDAAIAELMK
jgi:hypothetical protein